MRWWPRKVSQNNVSIDAVTRLEFHLSDLERRLIEQDEKTVQLAAALVERIEAVRLLAKERRKDVPD